MYIKINSIPHHLHRYETVGDWFFISEGNPLTCDLIIRVSELKDWRLGLLIGVHELIEAALCKHRGITEESVSDFDKANIDCPEPGALESAPYFKEHAFATEVERKLAAELEVDWDEYEKALDSLPSRADNNSL